uniref:RNA polymerase sigma factor n=1 Tax=Roseihalotalea indica TaxID=2867963 RepID=A0AA49GJL7_9BACT|nr:RNA polymerase sigma factor [Tunicatimonas sp. TK19036]
MQLEANHLWDRYRKGDKLAFEQLYYQHVNRLFDYGMRITRDTALVEDCIQDLFSDLWEKREQVNAVSSVTSYLLVSVRRRITRKLSTQQKNALQTYSDFYCHSQDFHPQWSEHIDEEKLIHLRQAFSKLSDKQKEVIYLRFYNQLSYEDIAEIMSVQVKAIYKLMARAIQVLREHVKTPTFNFFLLAILST